MDFKYKDCKKEMDMVNKAFLETMIEGDAHGRGFQYPIPTYSITSDFDWSDTENNRLLFEMTAKYGTPYFCQLHQQRHGAQRRAVHVLQTAPGFERTSEANPADISAQREHRLCGGGYHQTCQESRICLLTRRSFMSGWII